MVVVGDLDIPSSTEPTWRADGPPLVERYRLDDMLRAGLRRFCLTVRRIVLGEMAESCLRL